MGLVSGCTIGDDSQVDPTEVGNTSPPTATPPNPLPPITSKVVLDWEMARVFLPLDEYGNSDEEVNLLAAAQEIEYARCVTETHVLTEETLALVDYALALMPYQGEWFWGFWDAEFMTQHGWEPLIDFVDRGGLYESYRYSIACYQTEEYQSLYPVTRSLVSNNEKVNTFIEYAGQAWESTMVDPRFLSLVAQRDECVIAQGYEVQTIDGLGGAAIPETWTREARQTAIMVTAQCSDDMDFAQKAGDINATYEQLIIENHETELEEIRAIAQDRADRAKKILQEAGVL